jgi:hypothetical protein
MKILAEIATKLVNEMPLWMKFFFTFLIIFGIFIVPFKVSKMKDEQTIALKIKQDSLIYSQIGEKLDKLIKVTELNNMDNLSKRGAEIIIDQTFDLSKEIIFRRTIDEINKTDIDLAYRQVMIKDNLFNLINTLYKNDFVKLNQYSFNKKALGYILEDINPNIILDCLVDRIFVKKYGSKAMLEEDLWNSLTANFEEFKISVQNKIGI